MEKHAQDKDLGFFQRNRRWLLPTLIVISVLTILVGATVFYVVNIYQKMSIAPDASLYSELGIGEEPEEELADADHDLVFLVIGLDSRDGSSSMNTDTMLLLRYHFDLRTLQMLSIPRDLKTSYRGDEMKINGIFYQGTLVAKQHMQEHGIEDEDFVRFGNLIFGQKLFATAADVLKAQVEREFGIRIDHVMMVSFDFVEESVYAVGGLEIDVDRNMDYDDPTDNTHIHLKKGRQVLNGKETLDYIRFRKSNDGNHSDDIQRGYRQQQVIQALSHEILAWKSIPQAINLLNSLSSHFKTTLSLSEMMNLIQSEYNRFDSSQITQIQYETEFESIRYVVIPPEEKERIRQLLTEIPEEVNPDPISEQEEGDVTP